MEIGTPNPRVGSRVPVEPTIYLDEGNEGNKSQEQAALVGKVITDRSLNRGAIKNMLGKAWGNPEGLQVSDVGFNLFLFSFNNKEDALEVLNKTPWYVMNKLISLQFWNSQMSMKEIIFSRVQFWVQVHELPLDFISVKSAEKILNEMGEVLEIEDPMVEGKLIRPFIRARVVVNIHQALFTGCWVPRRNLPKVWVFIRYERLQDLCFNCGIIGHEQKTCQNEKVVSSMGKDIQKYSPRVGVPPAKPLKFILEEQERRRRYAQGGRSQEKDDTQGKGQDEHEEEEVLRKAKEDQLNKERFDYEVALEKLEGDGNLPDGWEEVPPNGNFSVASEVENQEQRPPPREHILTANLRLHHEFPAFRLQTREEERSLASFLGRVQSFGAGSPIASDPFATAQEEGSSETHNIQGDSKISEGGMGQQKEREGNLMGWKDNMRDFRVGREKGASTNTEGLVPREYDSDYDRMAHVNKVGGSQGVVEDLRKKPEWWAKEQEDNIAAYATLQADIQAIRDDLLTHLEGKKALGFSSFVRAQSGPEVFYPSGLGEHLSGPGEFLKVLNEPTLNIHPMEFTSIVLGPEAVDKCKRACVHVHPNSKDLTSSPRNKKRKYLAKKGDNYFVEFPPDDEEDSILPTVSIQEEEEKHLSVSMTRTLVLKRPRDYNDPVVGDAESEEDLAKRQRKGKQMLITAEEAGLSTPPTFQ